MKVRHRIRARRLLGGEVGLIITPRAARLTDLQATMAVWQIVELGDRKSSHQFTLSRAMRNNCRSSWSRRPLIVASLGANERPKVCSLRSMPAQSNVALPSFGGGVRRHRRTPAIFRQTISAVAEFVFSEFFF
jgi:hypothetical protein